METLSYNIIGAVRLVLPIALTVLLGSMAAFSFLRREFKQALLSRDRDGWRLVMLACGAVILAFLATTGTNEVALAAFGLAYLALGELIWIRDTVTDALLKPFMGALYLIGAVVVYVVAWGNSISGPNVIGLSELGIPVGLAIVFGSLTAFALLSEDFKTRILPQNADGGLLMVFGAAYFLAALFNSNPIVLVALTTFSAILIVVGGLVFIQERYTNVLLKAWMAPMYGMFAIALFTRPADYFTTAVVCAGVLFLIAAILGVTGMAGFMKSTITDKPTLKGFAPPIVYAAVAGLLFLSAIAALLIK